MGLGDFFKGKKEEAMEKQKNDAPNHWLKCPGCNALMYYKEVFSQSHICPKCNYHFRISTQERLEMLCDKDTFIEIDKDLRPIDPLEFVDKKSYKKRIAEGEEKTGRASSVIAGEALLNGIEMQIVLFDFAFMGGSLGSVEGEKIVRAIDRAVAKKQTLVILSTSGGARMQESTFSLMQMAKTSAALNKLADAKLPFISVLLDPTFGGVSASFAFLGDIIIAEPGAIIGFAGPRVIKQTIGADLPEGFQTAEFLLEHGLIDMVVDRKDLKKTLSDLSKMLNPSYANQHLFYS
ncbi:acetyl-CoA carboxylase subunit beta [Helicobacter cinaedi PAGU611]|uniref:acetyl-CoA carboxylase, carboxyltransferase subunit beta n=1 Tax=Helicobacter cinaedi TaxID=213 RepID=UPI00025D3665|nr:acetyl-CoA carboxylase, carboxyltransferase subunit beta [Helicobacter cinaedi]AWK62552.1 acetyl-CoA carboxylase, carboxyltransferase subunit beta [Helicobacter cinaedi]QOQ90646.1 acetyl-CoA carboxylase, carboxyltransferase subunit beta [Helicobacter cinaedi]QOQ96812.1 acetyl-CoA carboxylase, carboxyltransferase subunit beta [Helicobacter cinaedi]BAM13152.1 acetyl-CoA carboxylase subunit beta [Helicobacter cinaedi PAGU611]BBB21074.1 acetyl-coenzyme A carboxyl transferase beta chain [Helicob